MVFSPFRPSQQKPLATVIAAMAEVAPATSLAIAGHLAGEYCVPHRRALHRFDRLLHYSCLDNQRRTAAWLPLCGPGPRLRIARRLDGMAARPAEARSRGSRRWSALARLASQPGTGCRPGRGPRGVDGARAGHGASLSAGPPPVQAQGPRLSLRCVGIQCVRQIAPLIDSGVRFIRTHRPPPQLHRCTWLQAIEMAA
jgi:hypothetical protein